MWKKEEETPARPKKDEKSPRRSSAPGGTTPTAQRATIGRSITIQGDVSGDEDLLIQGKVDGSVDLDQHSVTVGPEGRVKANITGRVVTVEGEVEGDLEAQEQIILRASARVQGDIKAPRVVLEDGATFRGLVDMAEGSPKGGKAQGGTSDRSAGGSAGESRSSGTSADKDTSSGSTGESASKKKDASGTADRTSR